MSAIKTIGKAAALVGSLAFAGAANAAFIPFYFDDQGGGSPVGDPTEYERLVVTGAVNVEVTGFISPTQYTFTQSADFDITGIADPFGGLCDLRGCDFVANLNGATGIADLVTGQTTFTGGTITLTDTKIPADIATFDIVDGGVGIDNTGVPIPGGNNESSIIAVPTFFESGYFFFDAAATEDFADATFGDGPGEIDMSLFINLTLSDVQAQFSDDQIPVLEGIEFTADGSARFEVPVPAPASLALFSLGLLGLGAAARKRKVA